MSKYWLALLLGLSLSLYGVDSSPRRLGPRRDWGQSRRYRPRAIPGPPKDENWWSGYNEKNAYYPYVLRQSPEELLFQETGDPGNPGEPDGTNVVDPVIVPAGDGTDSLPWIPEEGGADKPIIDGEVDPDSVFPWLPGFDPETGNTVPVDEGEGEGEEGEGEGEDIPDDGTIWTSPDEGEFFEGVDDALPGTGANEGEGEDQSPGEQDGEGQSPGEEDGEGQSPGEQDNEGQTPGEQDNEVQFPGEQDSEGKPPVEQDNEGQSPGGQDSEGQSPGEQDNEGQSPGEQDSVDQFPLSQDSEGLGQGGGETPGTEEQGSANQETGNESSGQDDFSDPHKNPFRPPQHGPVFPSGIPYPPVESNYPPGVGIGSPPIHKRPQKRVGGLFSEQQNFFINNKNFRFRHRG